MKINLFVLLNFVALGAFSQTVNVDKLRVPGREAVTMNGEPLSQAKYVRVVSGSPYFNDNFLRGRLVLADGSVCSNVLVRIDMLDNTLQYLNEKGDQLIVSNPLSHIDINDTISGKKYNFIFSTFLAGISGVEKGWYQILATGPASLYKHYSKEVSEDRPYGSATYEQTIATATEYYIVLNASFLKVKKFKELPDLLQDKKAEITEYISGKRLSGKTDADYADVVSYYNSLIHPGN